MACHRGHFDDGALGDQKFPVRAGQALVRGIEKKVRLAVDQMDSTLRHHVEYHRHVAGQGVVARAVVAVEELITDDGLVGVHYVLSGDGKKRIVVVLSAICQIHCYLSAIQWSIPLPSCAPMMPEPLDDGSGST